MPWLGTLSCCFFFPKIVYYYMMLSRHWRSPSSQHDIPYFRFLFPHLDELRHFILSVSTNNLPITGRSSSRRGVSNVNISIFEKPVSDIAPYLHLPGVICGPQGTGHRRTLETGSGQKAPKALLLCLPQQRIEPSTRSFSLHLL